MSELKIIGKPVPRHDAWEKAFGLTSYAADFSMPGMLYRKGPEESPRLGEDRFNRYIKGGETSRASRRF